MTQAISSANVSDFAGDLAALLIENETTQAAASRLQRDAARQEFLSNAEQRVTALHHAADATQTGAIVSAAFTVAGGACQLAALETTGNAAKAQKLSALGSTLTRLSEPANALLGTSTAARYQAEAAHHEALSEQAKWQAGDASAALDKAERQIDKVLEQTQSIQRDQNAANNSIIGRI